MNKCKIYVEGVADQKFIADFISCHYNISLIKGENLIEIGGKDNLLSILPLLETNIANKLINIVIFDADEDVSERKKELQDFKKKHQVNFDSFLLPNDKNKGDLEDLLINIINSGNQKIFDCWDKYETCINDISKEMTLPAKKTKVYAYLEPLLGESKSQKKKIKEENRNYKNKEHWDLSVEYLNPLKDFLDKYFEKSETK